MRVALSIVREGRRVTLQAEAPNGFMFGLNGSHFLFSSEFKGFAGASERLYGDMLERLNGETIEPCSIDGCNCTPDPQ